MAAKSKVKETPLTGELSEEEKRKYLPHLHAFPLYKWSHDFIESDNKNQFLCAANQISKSSSLIRKAIHWATETDLWPKLWKHKPTTFWYLYPSKDMATTEFSEKWVKLFLPKKELKLHPKYGWEEKFQYGTIHHIEFNSGITLYFKSYEQSVTALQGTSVDFIGCDEECPVKYFPEINARRFATNGYFCNVFTATLGQKFWYDTIERVGHSDERFKSAFKRQVSMYDCLKYYKSKEKTPWTKKRIEEVIESCENESEVQRRVFGRFILDRNILYGSFDKAVNFVDKLPDLLTHERYLSVYIGKENMTGIVQFAVNPERTEVYLENYFQKVMNPVDLFLDVRILKKNKEVLGQYINESANDFIEISASAGEGFIPTKLSVDGTEKLVNSLFRTGSLKILSTLPSKDSLLFQLESMKLKDVSTDYDGFEILGALSTGLDNLRFNFKRIIDGREKEVEHPKLNPRMIHYKGLDRVEDDFPDKLDREFSEFNDSLEGDFIYE